MKPKLPTLLEITGPRPLCQRCGKALKPVTSWFQLPGHVERPLLQDEVANSKHAGMVYVGMGYQPDRVYRMTHFESIFAFGGSTFQTRVHFWRGIYRAVGRGNDRQWPLFCNLECACVFAQASWNAGVRMKGGPR